MLPAVRTNQQRDMLPVLEWVERCCPACGESKYRSVVEAPDPLGGEHPLWFAVVQCNGCGLHYTNPRPDAASLLQFYTPNYHPHRKATVLRPRTRKKAWFSLFRGRVSERRELPWQGEGRLLDFGCGSGEFLARMAHRGWKVAGVDISPAAIYQVQEKLGLKGYIGSLPHPQLTGVPFDVITMWHSLEHVTDPKWTLREAHRLLVPGGRLYLTLPNIRSFAFRWFGSAWFGLDLPRHLTHFCTPTLQKMLQETGFEVESIRLVKHSYWLRQSARLARKQGRRNALLRILQYKIPARVVGWVNHVFRQSDCLLAVARKPD